MNHNLTHPRKELVSDSATLSGSKNRACESCQPVKTQDDKDPGSDGSSCLEDDTYGLPDLNLALTIAIPSPSLTLLFLANTCVDWLWERDLILESHCLIGLGVRCLRSRRQLHMVMYFLRKAEQGKDRAVFECT
ncbi:hypothetical protein HHK36_029997 [Tetracentron sinense]|uniref:Uncharacterized protein n=1 Tax=Tetracentron sinense TaxID=13715 RepID=A0A834YBV7_TETSI|nr:hypothetical protein HHK36_029997 [Tetracentron sinense]